MGKQATFSMREILVLARAAAVEFRAAANTPLKRLNLCKQILEGINQKNSSLKQFSESLTGLPVDTKHYWTGTFYSLLLPPSDRRRQAVYFTPPHLAEAIIELLMKEGLKLDEHTIIDPAAGGAAFLSTIANKMVMANVPRTIIQKNLKGVEIDLGLARLSETLIGQRLDCEIEKGSIVTVGNALSKSKVGTFDLVVANPPYGRMKQTDLTPERWDTQIP